MFSTNDACLVRFQTRYPRGSLYAFRALYIHEPFLNSNAYYSFITSLVKMNPMLKPALIVLLLTSVACKINPDEETGWCKYYNDPHIIEFQSGPGAGQSQYLCRNNCTQIMVKNEFSKSLLLRIQTAIIQSLR